MSPVFCILSLVPCLLYHVFWITSPVSYFLSFISCLLFPVSRDGCVLLKWFTSCVPAFLNFTFTPPVSSLLSHVSCLQSHVSCLTSPVSQPALQSRSRLELRFFGWSRSWFKIWTGAGAEKFGSPPAPFCARQKLNDLKMFIVLCMLNIILYNK